MKLKTNIFLWVSLATVLPLTALVLGVTAYGEYLHRRDVDREVSASLNNIVAEIDRRLLFERDVVRALAASPAMRQFFPVLERAAAGDLHPEFFEREETLNRFLESFQSIVPGLDTLRVLDVLGNTLIKVRFGRRSGVFFDGIESFPYAEEELDDEEFQERLRGLPRDEVSFLLLPQSRWELEDGIRLPMLDAVVPLVEDGGVLGYLVVNLGGEQIDRILDLVPRPHGGSLMIVEINPDDPRRDGLVLYDDMHRVRFAGLEQPLLRIQETDGGARVWSAVQNQPYGRFDMSGAGSALYYLEYLPYPNQLVSWVVAVRIPHDAIRAPFIPIRYGILLSAAVAVLLSLLLAHFGARQIAAPIAELARSLKAYADGDRAVRVKHRGADEIRQLERSFNYMADTLERAEQERDRAQALMVQSAKLASLGRMAAGIGHEVNNPLTNILSLVKLLERELPSEDGRLRRDLASLREEALRASRIVKGVLNFARQVPAQVSRFPVAPWLEESLDLVSREARAHGVELSLHLAGDYSVEGDRGQLQQALINLLLNAIQASPPGGRAEVDVACREGRLIVTVRDHGPGIEPADLGRVFDPFFTTKPVGRGSGLGLSISLGIVQHHGGQLTVENHPGGGVVAIMQLPESGG